MRWQMAVARELVGVGLTFSRWLVLDAAWQLMLETGDAVSQAQVARRSGLDEMAVSRAMRALERVGWVDRGPDMEGPAWRAWVMDKGERVARQAALRVEAVSARVVAA